MENKLVGVIQNANKIIELRNKMSDLTQVMWGYWSKDNKENINRCHKLYSELRSKMLEIGLDEEDLGQYDRIVNHYLNGR